MTPRAAAPEDVAAVAGLEAAIFGADAWSPATVTAELTGPGRFAVVATDGDAAGRGTPVGYAVTTTSGDVTDLHRIAVHPAHRRRGLARAMLAVAVDRSREDGAERMLLEVSVRNTAAIAFYTRQGFAEADRRSRYYRDGSDAVVLGLPVRRPAGGGERMGA